MFDVLIVKADKDHVTGYVNEIIDTCSTVEPKIHVARRSISDTTDEKHVLKSKKLLFLLGADFEEMENAVANWVNSVFRDAQGLSEKVLIIHEATNNADDTLNVSELYLRTIAVTTLKDVFKWWPHTLSFIYTRKPKRIQVYLKTKKEIETPNAESGIDLEQNNLRDDLKELLQYNGALLEDTKENLPQCKLVVVVFGRDTSVSDRMYTLIRTAKLTGANVLFFFTHEKAFDRKITRMSTYRFTLSKYMEGILVIMRETAMKKLKLSPLRKPLIPTGPLRVTVVYDGYGETGTITAEWLRYPYGLEKQSVFRDGWTRSLDLNIG